MWHIEIINPHPLNEICLPLSTRNRDWLIASTTAPYKGFFGNLLGAWMSISCVTGSLQFKSIMHVAGIHPRVSEETIALVVARMLMPIDDMAEMAISMCSRM